VRLGGHCLRNEPFAAHTGGALATRRAATCQCLYGPACELAGLRMTVLHRFTVENVTETACANSSCVIPSRMRKSRMLLPTLSSLIGFPPSPIVARNDAAIGRRAILRPRRGERNLL